MNKPLNYMGKDAIRVNGKEWPIEFEQHNNFVGFHRAFPHIPQPVSMLPVLMVPNFKEGSYISRLWKRMKDDQEASVWKIEPLDEPFKFKVSLVASEPVLKEEHRLYFFGKDFGC